MFENLIKIVKQIQLLFLKFIRSREFLLFIIGLVIGVLI